MSSGRCWGVRGWWVLAVAVQAGWLAGGCGVKGPPASCPIEQAKVTIMLAEYNNFDAAEMATNLQWRAKRTLGSDDVWLEQSGLGVIVNYGHFATSREAKKGSAWVLKHYGDLDAGPYQFFYVREVQQPDPPAPEEWQLLGSVGSGCRHSLEIATYFNVVEKDFFGRKSAAVAAVRKLREEGETAFFLHGRLESRVYVGCFSSGVDPEVGQARMRYQFRRENEAKFYAIQQTSEGKEIRVPRRPVLVDVAQLELEKGF